MSRWFVLLLLTASVVLRGSAARADDVCAPDALLSRAAAELLLAKLERPSADELQSAVRAVGSDAVGLHALFVPTREAAGAEQRWLTALRARVDGELSCGRADGETGRLLVAVGRGAELAPIDERDRLVRGQLRAGFRDAELVIADAEAQLVRVGVTAEDLKKGVELAPDLALPLKVQLVARGPSGPRPVAQRELPAPEGFAANSSSERAQSATTHERASDAAASGARAEGSSSGDAVHSSLRGRGGHAADGGDVGTSAPSPSRATASPPPARGDPAAVSGGVSAPSHSAPAAAKELSELLLALRAERGRGGLRANRLLNEAATQHASNVCAQGRVAHEVEAGVGPDARLAQAGLRARVLGEAIARAADTNAALQALENSPSHLYTLLDPRFTDFGVGVAKDSAQKYCYVVLLCAWPRYVGKAKR